MSPRVKDVIQGHPAELLSARLKTINHATNYGIVEDSVGDPGPDRIRIFSGLPDPHPDPLVTSTDPAPHLSIIKQK